MIARDFDWRFLLPTPGGGSYRHLVLLGGSQDLADYALDRGVAREVSQRFPAQPIADAIVLFNRAQVDLYMAVQSLRPGGVLYAEFKHGLKFGDIQFLPGIRRTLARAGATQMGVYWCTPDFERHDAYVPLGSPEAIRWYLSNFYVGALRRQILGSVLRVLAGFGEAACSSSVRRFAVTAIAGPLGDARPSLLGDLSLPGDLRHPRSQLLVVAPGNRRVVLLPFAERGEYPLCALKLTRDSSRNARAESEQLVLASVYARLDDSMRRTIPRPYGCLRWGHLTASIEGAVPGRLLLTSRRDRTQRSVEILRRVAAWVVEFQRQTEVRRIRWGESASNAALAATLVEYSALFGETAEQHALFDEIVRRSSQLVDAPIPVVWMHGDLHPGNIHLSLNQVGVLDWVDGGEGPPFLDLFRFVLEWRAHIRGFKSAVARVRNFEEIFLQQGCQDSLVLAAREEIARYSAALEVDSGLIPVLLPLLWIQRAVRHRHKADQGRSATHRSIAALATQYVCAMAANPELLFAGHLQAIGSRRSAASQVHAPGLRRR